MSLGVDGCTCKGSPYYCDACMRALPGWAPEENRAMLRSRRALRATLREAEDALNMLDRDKARDAIKRAQALLESGS